MASFVRIASAADFDSHRTLTRIPAFVISATYFPRSRSKNTPRRDSLPVGSKLRLRRSDISPLANTIGPR